MTRIEIKIEDRAHQRMLDQMMGVALTLEVLKDHEDDFGKMPGYNSSRILVQGLLAELRIEMATRNLRLAASKGIDIATHGVAFRGGDDRIICDPLEDMGAEDAPGEPKELQEDPEDPPFPLRSS